MFRRIIPVVCIFIMAAGVIHAQLMQDGGYFFGDLGPDDIVITIPEGGILVESAPIEHVIEGVGTISYSSVPIYNKPAKKGSKIIRYAIPGEKMVITASDDDWYAVKMYDGKDGFIEKRNLKTVKVFYDESVTTNSMDKRLNFELRDLVHRFNSAITSSSYLEKYRIVPRLAITTTSNKNNKMVITMEYSAVDENGAMIPSKQMNALNGEMKKFIELLFIKMLPTRSVSYKIIIKQPVFSSNGRVLNTQKAYAELTLNYEDIDPSQIKGAGVAIFDKIKCNISKDDLFSKYPY